MDQKYMVTFQNFLEDKYNEDYHGDDDGHETTVEDWIESLTNKEMFDYAEMYGKRIFTDVTTYYNDHNPKR